MAAAASAAATAASTEAEARCSLGRDRGAEPSRGADEAAAATPPPPSRSAGCPPATHGAASCKRSRRKQLRCGAPAAPRQSSAASCVSRPSSSARPRRTTIVIKPAAHASKRGWLLSWRTTALRHALDGEAACGGPFIAPLDADTGRSRLCCPSSCEVATDDVAWCVSQHSCGQIARQ